METILTILVAILPTIILCFFVYQKDVLEKEPLGLLMGLFFTGVASTIPAALMESIIMMFFDATNTSFLNIFLISFIGISLIEEGYKALFAYTIGYRNRNFNHIYDGIVYCVFLSLGFATFENILYVTEYGISTGLLRAIVSVPGHAFFGVAMGYYMGIAKLHDKKNNQDKKRLNLSLSIIMPIIFHGLFDFLLLVNNETLMLVFFCFVGVLYVYSYLKIRKLSRIMRLID